MINTFKKIAIFMALIASTGLCVHDTGVDKAVIVKNSVAVFSDHGALHSDAHTHTNRYSARNFGNILTRPASNNRNDEFKRYVMKRRFAFGGFGSEQYMPII